MELKTNKNYADQSSVNRGYVCAFEQNYLALIRCTGITSLRTKPGIILRTVMVVVEEEEEAMANMTHLQSCARDCPIYCNDTGSRFIDCGAVADVVSKDGLTLSETGPD